MKAHGKAGRAASVVSALASLLLAHSVAADDEIVVYGEHLEDHAERDLASAQIDSAELLVALHDELRASLRNDLLALRIQTDKDRGSARAMTVATVAARTGG
jgi:hypothetical protein